MRLLVGTWHVCTGTDTLNTGRNAVRKHFIRMHTLHTRSVCKARKPQRMTMAGTVGPCLKEQWRTNATRGGQKTGRPTKHKACTRQGTNPLVVCVTTFNTPRRSAGPAPQHPRPSTALEQTAGPWRGHDGSYVHTQDNVRAHYGTHPSLRAAH